MIFEVINELTLKIHMNAGEYAFTKAGAFIGGESIGEKNYKFEKMLLGTSGNIAQDALRFIGKKLLGENLPIMKVNSHGENITYYANDEQHVTVVKLNTGECISVESENILAFTQDCDYSMRFLAQGVISQKGFATSTLTGRGPNALVALLTDGNPIVLSNVRNGAVLTADPDAVVAWSSTSGKGDPKFKLDLSWKNLIGQASGESYMFEWNTPVTVIIQPHERTSGLDISVDGRRTGSQAQRQSNQTLSGAVGDAGSALGGAGDMLSHVGSMLGGGSTSGSTGGQSGNGLGGIIGNIFR